MKTKSHDDLRQRIGFIIGLSFLSGLLFYSPLVEDWVPFLLLIISAGIVGYQICLTSIKRKIFNSFPEAKFSHKHPTVLEGRVAVVIDGFKIGVIWIVKDSFKESSSLPYNPKKQYSDPWRVGKVILGENFPEIDNVRKNPSKKPAKTQTRKTTK